MTHSDIELDKKGAMVTATPVNEVEHKVGIVPEHGEELYSEEDTVYPPGHALYIDPKEEKKIVRSLDMHLTPLVLIIYIIAALDRSNIGNTAAAGMTKDINLKGNELNIAVSIYFVTYTTCEVPVTLFLRQFRPRIVLPGIMLVWGLVMVGSGFLKNFGGLVVTRVMIGLLESGMFPFLNVYMTGFYKRNELSQRLACIFLAVITSGAVGGLFAAGFLKMAGVAGLKGWQWVYLMEGIVTAFTALLVYIFLPDSPETAYFFNEHQKEVVRIREQQREAYMGEHKFSTKQAGSAFKDPKVYLSAWIQFTTDICLYGISTFLPVIIAGMDTRYTGIKVNLMTVPVYVVSGVIYMSASYFMGKFKNRCWFIGGSSLLCVVGYLVLMTVNNSNANAKYGMTFIVAAFMYVACGGNVTWLCLNQAPQFKRSVAVPIQQGIGNLGGIVAGQIYRLQDKPRYMIGHGVSLGAMAGAAIGTVIKALYLHNVNRKRDLLTKEERAAAMEKHPVGDLHPDFRMQL